MTSNSHKCKSFLLNGQKFSERYLIYLPNSKNFLCMILNFLKWPLNLFRHKSSNNHRYHNLTYIWKDFIQSHPTEAFTFFKNGHKLPGPKNSPRFVTLMKIIPLLYLEFFILHKTTTCYFLWGTIATFWTNKNLPAYLFHMHDYII